MGAMASMMAPSYGSRGWAGGTLDWWPKARQPLELICAPKRVGPRRSSRFPWKSATSEGAWRGPKVRIMDPQWPAVASVRELGSKAMPPVVAVLVRAHQGRRVHRCPQRARTPDPCGLCPCKPATFGGPPEGAMIAIVDPQASRRRGGGRRPCPRWGQYLSPPLKRQSPAEQSLTTLRRMPARTKS
jgi:hypothetical protein